MGFAPLSNEGTFLSSSFHRPRSGCFPTASLEIRRALRPIPFHRPHPRRSPSRGVATTSDSSSKLESRSDLVVSHDFVGFLRRWLGFSPSCSSPFRVTKDLRACCVPLPIVGFDAFLPPHPVESAPQALPLLTTSVAVHTDSRFPASKFVPPGGFPPPAAVPRRRGPCLLGLFVVFDPRPSRGARFQTHRSCRIEGTWSLEALLRWRVRTIERLMRTFVGLPSLGLVPLRGRLHVVPFGSTEFR